MNILFMTFIYWEIDVDFMQTENTKEETDTPKTFEWLKQTKSVLNFWSWNILWFVKPTN